FLVGRPFGNAEMTPGEHREKVTGAMRTVRRRAGRDAEPIIALLEKMFAFEPSERPSAEETSEECRRLSKSIPGEDQFSFAKRFVPQVYSYVADESVEVDRTVGPSAPGAPAEVARRGHTRRLLREETIVPAPPRAHRAKARSRPILPVRHVTLPITAAAVLVAISFAFQLAPSASASGTAVIANQRVHAATAISYPPLPSIPPPEDAAQEDTGLIALDSPPADETTGPEETPTPTLARPPEPPNKEVEAPTEAEEVDLSRLPLLRAVKFTLAGAEAMEADSAGLTCTVDGETLACR
ncbi:MAG: hypothetical protein JRI25_10150, partial [Deltaproteobacteria bacterium]|nr:hypothetical protein [Deltaproteobacteria bacterium]